MLTLEQMKLKIDRVGQTRDVATKFGLKKKISFLFGDKWAECWVDKRVQSLKAGDEVEGELTSREYNGKTYWDLILPKAGDENFKRIEAKLDEIISLLKKESF